LGKRLFHRKTTVLPVLGLGFLSLKTGKQLYEDDCTELSPEKGTELSPEKGILRK
jgi:hypothetical protein